MSYRTFEFVFAVFIVFILCISVFGGDKPKAKPDPKSAPAPKQEKKPTPKPKPKPQPKPQPPPVPPKTVDRVILVINSDDINKVLVIAVNGEWLSDAREIRISSSIGSNSKPTVECVMYRGLFRPTSPSVKKWKLESIITASPTDFQKILDGLQNGKFVPPTAKEKK